MTVRATTGGELILLRGEKQFSETFLIPRIPNIIYTAQLNGVPSSNDMVGQIAFINGVGTLGNIKNDMKVLVGSVAGAADLGYCRIRKTPIAGTFYIGELSDIEWIDACHLTVIDDFDLFPRHIKIVNKVTYMDHEVAYSNQHTDFDPTVIMGGHCVLSFTGDPVSIQRSCADSWVFDGTISSILWEAPGSSSLTNSTTTTPTITYNQTGHYVIYCNLTTNTGKTFFGARYIFVIDEANDPMPSIGSLRLSSRINEGGTSCTATLLRGVDISEFPERAFIIAYEKANYGTTKGSINYLTGEENVLCFGRITDESISFNAENGEWSVSFSGYHHWLKEIACFPAGIEDRGNTPSVWTDMGNLTVDKAVWHILHWHSTATRLFDFHRSNDTRQASELQSLSTTIWSQIQEVAGTSIFAEIVFEPNGQCYLRIEPQLVPAADRATWPIVQEITGDDYQGELTIELNPSTKVSKVDLSGITLSNPGTPLALFSLANGHIPKLYGDTEMVDRILLEDQITTNSLAGLIIGWKDARIESIRVDFVGNHRMFSIAQYCYAYIQMISSSNLRGVAYSGNLVPRELVYIWDSASGYAHTTATFQPESIEQIAVNGDIPEETGVDDYDFDRPPTPTFPPLPEIPWDYIPSTQPNSNHPKKVVIATAAHGILYTDNFDDANPTWKAMNNGLTLDEYTNVGDMCVTPSGAIYIVCGTHPDSPAKLQTGFGFASVFRAPSIGSSWSKIQSYTNYPVHGTYMLAAITGIGYNPNLPDSIAITGCRNDTYAFDSIAGYLYLSLGTNGSVGAPIVQGSGIEISKQPIMFSGNKWSMQAFRTRGILATRGAFWSATIAGASTGYIDCTALGLGYNCEGAGAVGLDFFCVFTSNTNGYIVFAGGIEINYTGIQPDNYQAMAFSPTGTHGMAGSLYGTWTAYKTTDGGTTWNPVSGVIPNGSDVWENCKDISRWIFGGGTIIRLTVDQGSSYVDKMGNLAYIAPLVDVQKIRFIS